MAATETARLTSENTFPNPLQILLGFGEVGICTYRDMSGGFGLMFSQAEKGHEIGEAMDDEPIGLHDPQLNEVYIHCTNKASAVVLLGQVQKMVDAFDGE